ncbi:ElyC/SanA/YdcF family protein [Saccharothrix violaceirubra]|uniref:Vancomycin permeability regulator SanA n=1 Tax=Saccharothrix violaceirubra TaxID=413306 RepID=A0A7W7T7T1_9PSEU|nr:ElyC/SanA/YdcF family protein [Saccharothrix violaceirubra]MBB4968095.1 vancomycin permeability regulator SanA [Saccharothrix violaceirubra]
MRLFRKVRWKRVLLVAGLVALIGTVPYAWVLISSAPYRFKAEDVPETPVALVLGAGLRDGRPTPFLAGRLDVAADLFRRGKVKVLLVSGDNSTVDYDEPGAMRRYLVEHGVPERFIVADYAGLDTWDSCTRAKRIFGVDRLTVVSQVTHLPRAVTLCRRAGVDAYGVGHETWDDYRGTTVQQYVRESVAAYKALWEGVVVRRDPKFLGPQEPGVIQALDA